MGNIYFTSDTHFGHDKDFLWSPRGYNNIYEHDKDIIKKWNNIVSYDDEVYHLGDVMLGDNDYGLSCIKQLNGKLHIIRGNHDSNTRIELYKNCFNVVEVTEGKYFKWNKYNFYLSHYPTLTSNHDADKPLKARTISLCGHSHITDPYYDWDKGLIYHVELDTNNCYPILIDDIIAGIKLKIGKEDKK